MEGEVIEGFLCPICYKDLKTALNLNTHFQEQHQEDQKLFKSVKDIYEKAKKKIIKNDHAFSLTPGDSDAPVGARRIIGYQPSDPTSIENVSWRSHTDRFKAIRDLRNERYAAQTNTLVIRLEKLLRQLPADAIRRKAYEQEIVPWLDDKNVNLCPGCAKPFNLIKRKHHCRLCGSVMCKNCTFLLPLDTARKIAGVIQPENAVVTPLPGGPATLSRLQPVQAVQSVLSLDGAADSEFRLCEHCHLLLHARETARQNRSERPIIAQFYDRLRTALDACDGSVRQYHTMYNSLCAGETKYTLTNAKELRVELLRLAETVDSISKKILVLGQNTNPPPTGARLQLQQTVRNAAALYLKQNVISLPSLPTEAELIEFQDCRRLEMERKIEAERRDLEELILPEAKIGNSSMPSKRKEPRAPEVGKVTMEAGWTPTIKQAIITDDPVLQQIGILHGFIEQAEKAGKHEESQALRRNLAELEQLLDEREAEKKASST